MADVIEDQGPEAPPAGTVERWAWDYVTAKELSWKLSPPRPPRAWESHPVPRRVEKPGRPPELCVVRRSPRTPGPDAIRDPEKRARLLHVFLHHELQAAELFCWTLLSFPEAPRPFKGGLVHIALDEVRHLQMYAQHLVTLGFQVGDFPVRDWFWERVPACSSPAHFVAVMGMGFEGANLDHAPRFADRLSAVGDPEAAAIMRTIELEERSHVRFALRWFRRFLKDTGFGAWAAHLPPPLSPIWMRGSPINRKSRMLSGFTEGFLDELSRWMDHTPGS